MNLITERSDKSLINKTTVTYLLVVVFVLLIKVGLKAQSPPFASDCSRTVMAFDGTDDYLDVQGTTIDGNAGTWEAWVRKSNWASQTNGILFGNDIAFSTTNTMYLSFHSAVGLHFRYGDNTNEPTTGGAIYGQFTNGFAADSWHHIAVTWAHVSGTTTLQMFVDGVKQSGFASGSRQTHNALIDPGSSLNFGFSQGENYLEAGALAEIRTWSVVRTEAEIQSAMNTVLTGMESGLTGYWPLDEASGTTAASNSVSGAPDANLTNADENTVWETLSNVKIAVSQEGMALDHQDSFDFGMVESGESVTKTFTITNQGSTTLSLNGSPIIVVDGADATEVVADASATSSSLAAGASTTFDLTFTAGDTGSKAASISIATDDTCLPAFELNLTGESVVTTKPDAITVSDASPCLNETITLTAVGGNIFGDTEWVWYEGDASGAPLGTGTSIDVTPQRSARYLVLAEDAGTPLTDFTVSETVTLSTETVIQVDQQPASSVVATGNTHSLIVRASGSGLTYQWQKDGVDLVDGSNVTGTQTAELSFAAVTGADDGIYRCIISNSCNTQTSGDASLVTTSDAYVTLPLFEDFESADGGFTASNLKGPTTWEYGTSAGGANSGTEVWETDLDGIIQNNEINVLISPNYLLSPELAGAELSFALNYDLTLFQQSGTPVTDRWFQAAELNISTDNGANWTKITDFEEGGYSRSSGFIFNDANLDWPLWTDNSGGWITARVNLADYVGQEVQFRIIVSTTSGFAGWFFGSGMKIDDWGISELDNIAPTASFEISDGATDNSAKEVQLTFSEEVSFALADLEVANGTLSNLQTTDNQNYTFDVTPVTDGFVTISINEAVDPIEDLNGNQLANAPELTFLSDNANSEVFIYTTEDPVFSSFTADIVFSKPVSNFEVGDISATNAGLAKLQTTDNINFTVEVTPAMTGTVTLNIPAMVAEDQFGNFNDASETVSLNFNPASAPVLDPIGDQSVDEETELTFTASATDLNQDEEITYSLDATSLGKGMTIDVMAGTFSWTPSESQDGDHTVTITATDDSSGALSDEETITITVNEVNQNPTVTVGPAVWHIPEDAYASRSYQIDDPDGHEVTIELDDDAVARGFGLLNVNNPVVNKLVFWTAPLEVEETSFDVTLTVTDDFGGLTEFVITINLQEVNQLPALNTIGDQTTDEMTELAFTVSGTDADLPAQSLSYSISDGELTGMSIDSETGEFSWTPAEDQDGTHTVTFAISDDFAPDAGVTTEEMTITVNETNQSPVLGPVGDQLVDERAELTFTVTATDPDTPANELAFALDATAESKGMTIDESTGEFSWTPTEAQDGDHTVTITVTDNGAGLLTDDETITITVNELPNTWDGSAWSDGVAPTGEDVQIDDDYNLSTSGSFTANNLMVNAQLMVDGGETLIVNNELVNNGSLMIESGSSLITYASGSFSGDPVIAERITRHADGKYSFVGTPFEQSSDNTGDDLGTIVFQYDESVAYQPDDGLGRWLGLNDAQLIPGKGYAQAGQQTLTYSGTPNTGTINFTGTYTGTYNDGVDEQTEGWNLIANPYPAAIEVQAFLDENTNLEGAVYLWDDNGSDVARGTNADYVVANGTVATNTTPAGGQGRYNGHIGSSQGFFVKLADDTDTEISFTEAMRTAGSNADGNFFRDAQPAYVRVNLSGSEGFFKQLIIGRVQGISDTEIDRSFDARVFEESANAFYSLKGGEALAIQGLSAREEVPLGYALPENGRYVIGIEADKFGGEPIFLYDAELDITTNLNEDVYEFSANSGVAKDRFQLLLKPAVVTEVSGHQVAEFYSYSSENQLKVFLRSTVETTVSANLINLNGRVVLTAHQRNSDEEMTIDTSHLPKGVYVLQVSGKTFSGKRKVIVR